MIKILGNFINEWFDLMSQSEDVIKMETGVVTDKQGNVIKIETPQPEYLYTL